MKYIELKGTQINVSKIGLGCNMLAESFLQNKNKDPEKLIKTALEVGINFFDTASIYSLGKSEFVLGSILKKQRKDCIIASKGGKKPSYSALISNYFPPLKSVISSLIKSPKTNKLKKITPKRSNFNPEFILNEFKNSMNRLNTDYIDVYYLHSPSIDQISSGKTFDLLRQLKKEGRIRCFGISVYTYEDLYWIHQNEEVDIVQIPYNPFYGEGLDINKVSDRKFSVVARDIFSKGLLTQESYPLYIDFNSWQSVKTKADDNHMPVKEYSFRYSLKNPEFESCLIGTSNPLHLMENIELLNKINKS